MKEMCWLPNKGNQSTLMLHLREHPHQPWKVYTASPHAVPDHKVPGASKGYATFQKLRQICWSLISSDRAKSSTSFAMANYRNS